MPRPTTRPAARLAPELLEDRAVPAAATWVNDSWHLFLDADQSGGLSAGDVVTNGNDPGTGPLTGYFYGTQAFGTVTSGPGVTAPVALPGLATINAAVAATDAGGTVNVLPGTYSEAVVVGKALTLRGAQAGAAVAGRTAGGAAESVLQATGGAAVTVTASGVAVDGFTLTAGTNTARGVEETTAVVGTAVRNSFVSGFTTGLGVAVAAGSSGFAVTGNELFGNYGGVYLSANATNGTVSRNVIRDNTVTGAPDAGAGLVLEGNNAGVSVAENAIRGNRTGVYVFDFGSNFAGTALSDNALTGNTAGVTNTNAGVLNASGNWWGVATAAGVAAQAGANVDYTPWLATGTDTGAAPGFQGDFGSVVAGDVSPQVGTVGRLQEAIDLVTAGGTVTASAGTYVENVTINKNLALVSAAGRAATTIQGVTNGALGTVVVANNTSAVTVGGTNQGFTIVGIDNPSPGIESAAVYFAGSHTGARVLGNEIRAAGDEALLTEFGATVSGFVISGNVFSGTTFVGTPADNGFGNQFSTPNVPRQLVVIGNGGGNAATALATNITFTNNQITGTAGGTNAGGEQGNNLVTIDAANSTVTGNTFAGTTTRFGAALRVRRPGTTISGNTFGSAGMGAGTEHLFVQNNATPLQAIAAANTFDRGAYTDGGSDLSVSLAGGAGRAATGSVLRVLAGTYNESLNLNALGTPAANKALTLSPDGGTVTITGDLTFGADDGLVLDVSGAAADRLAVTGAVAFGGTLTLNGVAAAPLTGPTVLIANAGTDAITGSFAGLPSGTLLAAPGGRQFTLAYVGGTGNDLTLLPDVLVDGPGLPVVTPPGGTPAVNAPVPLTAVGAGPGAAGGHVKVYNADGSLRASFFAFPGFVGGVTVATGDVTGDGVDDIVVGAGPGAAGGHVKVFDGNTFAEVASFFAFPGFLGGVNVAVGDVTGDGRGDVVVGSGAGAPNGHVKVFSGAGFGEVASFFAYAGFGGGVNVAVGDYDGNGTADIVTGTATGAGHVKVFDRSQAVLASFLTFPGTNGVTVAAGDLNGDNFAELVIGSGPGAPGQVSVVSGRPGVAPRSIAPIAGTNGARVAVGFANADNVLDILVGSGPGTGGSVRAFDGASLAPLAGLLPFDGFTGGLSVG